ncbi:hypothetical protein M0R45_020068 [Rubus argutus]|uniref:Uncharacterized protein n=1 Tax=Rubus argutus TaxID=59490 RepID=A0AAW1X9K9_RUBAR
MLPDFCTTQDQDVVDVATQKCCTAHWRGGTKQRRLVQQNLDRWCGGRLGAGKRGGEREAGGGVVFWAHGRERREGIRRCTTGSGGSWLGLFFSRTLHLFSGLLCCRAGGFGVWILLMGLMDCFGMAAGGLDERSGDVVVFMKKRKGTVEMVVWVIVIAGSVMMIE